MSLETVLQENTTALREFTTLMTHLLATEIVKGAHKEGVRAAIHAEPAPLPVVSVVDLRTPDTAPTPTPTAKEVGVAILTLAKARGREAAVAVLAHFKVTKVPELTPEQWAPALARAEEALA